MANGSKTAFDNEMVYGEYRHRGHYTAAGRYELYIRVVKQYLNERTQRVSKMLFFTTEKQIYIFCRVTVFI